MKKAFTLIELMVVVVIIGILAGIVMINLESAQSKARDARRKSDLNTIAKAVQIYRENIGNYILQDDSGDGGVYGAGYGMFNCGGDTNCTGGGSAYTDYISLNKALISRSYLSGNVTDPTGGICGTGAADCKDRYFYTYDFFPTDLGDTKASIWCVLENPSQADRDTLNVAAYTAAYSDENRVIGVGKTNYAVTLIP